MNRELEKLLNPFAAHWGLSELTPDQQGRYSVVLDGHLRIALFQTGPHIYLEARPGALAADARQVAEQLSHLLRKQLAGMEQHEEVLSLDPTTDEVLLFRRMPAQTLSLDQLEKALETFSNRLEFWRRELSWGSSPPASLPMHIVFP